MEELAGGSCRLRGHSDPWNEEGTDIDIFVSSTGNCNFFTLDQMKKLDNNAVVGMSVNLQRD